MTANELTTMEKFDAVKGLLDKTAESTGVAKCGLICAIDEFVRSIRNDVLIMQEQLNDLNNPHIEIVPGPEIEPETETTSQE